MGSDSDSSQERLSTKSPRGQGHHSGSESEKSRIPQHITFSFDDYNIETEKAFDPYPLNQALIPNSATAVTDNLKFSSRDPEDSKSQNSDSNGVDDSTKYTKRQLLILLVYSFTEFFSGAVVSLQAPFYPAEAEKKGVTASEYGAVFGIFEFTVFLVSFVYGKYMSSVGPKFVYNLGLFVTGVTSMLFGMLDQIEDRTTFFALSMVTRIVEALAAAGCMNAAFTIIALEFPKSVATTFATMETLFGVGLTCGPIIGGALFQLGGYSLPFLSTGILLVFTSVFTFFVLPTPIDTNENIEDGKGLVQLVRIPEVTVSAFSIFASAISIGHLSSTLEPHIREFELDSVSVGLVIVISGATYAILAPMWGKLCDRFPKLDAYMLIGSLFTIVGYILIGPAPFLPLDTILWVTCVGLVCHGIGLGACLVSSFIQCLTSANAHGFPDNVSTYSLVSGIWASFFSLGNFLGPTISGVLYDTVGFRNGTLFVIGLHSFVAILIGYMMCCGKKPKIGCRKRLSDFTESDPLLGTSKTYNNTKR